MPHALSSSLTLSNTGIRAGLLADLLHVHLATHDRQFKVRHRSVIPDGGHVVGRAIVRHRPVIPDGGHAVGRVIVRHRPVLPDGGHAVGRAIVRHRPGYT